MNAERVKVKRDGPRGWHWIAASSFDPASHELVDAPTAPAPSAQIAPPAQAAPAPKGRRVPKTLP